MCGGAFSIRHAGGGDIGPLQAIARAQKSHKDEDYFLRCLEEQTLGRRLVLLAFMEGEAVGYCMLNWSPRYGPYRRLGIPEIQDLNVVPEARRRGAASGLIAFCESEALRAGKDMIGISVGLHADYGAAQRLYVRLGYVPDGNGVTYDREPVRQGEIRPVDDDLCLMMAKPIGQPVD